ncbi:MAG: alpha/beta fold hydrolase [Pseudomonadota bacterium]
MSAPILLLPGMMCDARLYAHQTAALASAIAWPAPREETISDMAEALLAEAPERFALAGLSMGGILAMEVIARAPERVTRLALLDTNHLAEVPERRVARAPQIAAVMEGRLEAVMVEEMKPAYLAPDHPETSAILRLVRDMALDLGPEVFRAQSLALRDRPDQTETLRGVAVPTLILVGAHDRLCPVSRHEAMRDLVPGARLRVLPDAGHLTPLEAPDAVTEALRDWSGW